MLRALPLALLCVGCVPAIVGEGDIDKETVSVSPFSALQSDGIDVELRAGDEPSVTWQSDENILPYLEAHVVDGVLTIGADKDVLLYPTELIALVTAPGLESVTVRDGADLRAEELDAAALAITSRDDGDVTLAGAAGHLSADITGKGEFDAQDLTAAEVDFASDGSGDAWLTATDAVRITLTGSAQVSVYGDPVQREVETSGSGAVSYY